MKQYVGFDVSKEETAFCIIAESRAVVAQGKAASDPESLAAVVARHCPAPARVVLETGASSAWLARGLADRGVTAEVLDARQVHAVLRLQTNKSDAKDARMLAEIARSGFCRPLMAASEATQEERLHLKARAHLVRARRDTGNTIRGLLRSFGLGFPKGSAKLIERVRAALAEHPRLAPAIEPLLRLHEALTRALRDLDAQVMARARDDDLSRLLMTVPGVGATTARAFLAAIDDPARFAKGRNVGAYLGLTARRHQSGEVDYSGRISKRGDPMARSLLYEAAHCLLTRVRRPHPLKDWARRIKKRAGHKKACVALARKLAVIMHRMLTTGEPFRWPEPATA